MKDFDDLISEVGDLGRYQIFVYLLICIAMIPSSFHVNVGLFLTPNVKHRCAIPGYREDTFASQGLEHDILVNFTLPQYYDEKRCVNVTSSCERYTNGDNSSITTCDDWVFDKSTFTSTALEDYGLVCGWARWRTYSMMAPMVGMLVGSIVFGTLSDRFGRKKLMLICNTVTSLVGIATAWAPDLAYYMIYRFLIAGIMTGAYLSAFVLGVEIVGKSRRMVAGIAINLFWAVGVEVLAGVAYAIRDWHNLQLALSVPSLIFLVYIWIIPESPRWLMTNGRREEGMRVIENIAKYNKTRVPDRFYNITNSDVDCKIEDGRDSGKVWQLFSTPRLTLRSIVIFINWIAVTLAYYGLLMYTGNVSGNIYLNFALGGLVEFPAYGLCLVLLNRLGRRVLHSTCMIVSGLACLCSIFPVVFRTVGDCQTTDEINIYILVLSLLGRLFTASAFAIIYIFSSELFPTTIRNSAMGLSSMLARLGGIAAPYIATLNVGGRFGEAFPILIFGVVTLAAGLMSLLLPETLNRKLPDTVEEADRFGREEATPQEVAQPESANVDEKTSPM